MRGIGWVTQKEEDGHPKCKRRVRRAFSAVARHTCFQDKAADAHSTEEEGVRHPAHAFLGVTTVAVAPPGKQAERLKALPRLCG